MRLEKGYRSWGTDMTAEHDPAEAGLGFAVSLDKGDFIGRDALSAGARLQTIRRLLPLTIADRGAVVMGKEPVEVDGRSVGYVDERRLRVLGGCADRVRLASLRRGARRAGGDDPLLRGGGPGDRRDGSALRSGDDRLRS